MSGHEIVIFGCGGHSRSVVDIILLGERAASFIFVDENARENEKIFGFPVFQSISLKGRPFFFAIGDNSRRKKIYQAIGADQLISVISPLAHVGQKASYGKGVFIGNFSHVGPEAAIGNNTIINNGAIIEHEVVIGEHTHIAPQAVISGRTKIGDCCFIGAGASIRDGIQLCSNVTIGAGSTVIKNIMEVGTYVGCPVRRLA